ncbi:hypothetical protein [Campylobacter sp. JMF_03 NE3]|uniref:hypothetical protein n=1 Tax=Campylobacter sp. JMF_03 NE3 TaxID=2983831 RepID=UPI0022E9C5B1|nr:hypothetical protein [Campylobacter sp. JMF_03 NE3]MDA3053682.1 hypothetical protein [Campylobacter sp. JMF_03 NE3]
MYDKKYHFIETILDNVNIKDFSSFVKYVYSHKDIKIQTVEPKENRINNYYRGAILVYKFLEILKYDKDKKKIDDNVFQQVIKDLDIKVANLSDNEISYLFGIPKKILNGKTIGVTKTILNNSYFTQNNTAQISGGGGCI